MKVIDYHERLRFLEEKDVRADSLSSQTIFCIAVDLTTATEFVQTHNIAV